MTTPLLILTASLRRGPRAIGTVEYVVRAGFNPRFNVRRTYY